MLTVSGGGGFPEMERVCVCVVNAVSGKQNHLLLFFPFLLTPLRSQPGLLGTGTLYLTKPTQRRGGSDVNN